MELVSKNTMCSIGIVFMFLLSGISMPQTLGAETQNNFVTNSPTRLELGNGTYVDVSSEGNVTTFTFSDGSRVTVNASVNRTSIEIESANSTEIMRFITVNEMPFGAVLPTFPSLAELLAPGLIMQRVERSSGAILSETTIVRVSDNRGTYGVSLRTEETSPTGDTTLKVVEAAWNESFFDTIVTPPHIPGDPINRTSIGISSPFGTSPPGPVRLFLDDRGSRGALNASLEALHVPKPHRSFFDTVFDTESYDGRRSTLNASASTSEIGSSISFTNSTSGYTNGTAVEPGAPPVATRWPDTVFVDPLRLFDVVDILVTATSVQLILDTFSVVLYLDKMVINYYTFSGIYLPIVIFFETYEVHISLVDITIIIFLMEVELLMIVEIFQYIKIEIYKTFIVIVFEIINIAIIEITILFLNVSINIDISIVVNLTFVLKLTIVVKKVIKWIIVLPILILIFYIPFPWPVKVPVPTPHPYPIPNIKVNLWEQKFDEKTNTMNLSYLVTNQDNVPISGAVVNLQVDNGTHRYNYVAKEDLLMIGVYRVDNIPLMWDAKISVNASYNGMYAWLDYTQEAELTPPSTVTSGGNVTTTVTKTINHTVTTSNLTTTTLSAPPATTANPLPFQSTTIFFVFIVLYYVSVKARKRRGSLMKAN